MKLQATGAAWIEEHPKGSGKYRVRARIDGKNKTIAPPRPRAQAEEARDAYRVVSNAAELRQGVTVKQFGIGFNERRRAKGVRGHYQDEKYWGKHVAADQIGDLPVASLERRDVVEWLDRRKTVKRGKKTRPMAHRTRVKVLNLLRVALAEAVDRGLLEQNPAASVKVHRAGAATSVDDLEGVLVPVEQRDLMAATPAAEVPVVAFALTTGLRQAEQWWLTWGDVREDSIIVRRSKGGLAPKSGKPRVVHLLPPAKAALDALRAAAKAEGRKLRVTDFVFPALRGSRRQEGKPPRHWAEWLAAAGITRHVRWHDLRHTCATSLLAGWWGRKWTLDEVCEYLGHSSVTVTERYARKLKESQILAVSETPGFVLPQGRGSAPQLPETTGDADAFVKHRSQVQIQQSAPRGNRTGRYLHRRKCPRGRQLHERQTRFSISSKARNSSGASASAESSATRCLTRSRSMFG